MFNLKLTINTDIVQAGYGEQGLSIIAQRGTRAEYYERGLISRGEMALKVRSGHEDLAKEQG